MRSPVPTLLTRPLLAAALLLSAACGDRGGERQPPRPPPAPPPAPALPAAPDAPIGTFGPAVRVTSVTDAATGAPIALGGIADSAELLVVAARGSDARGRDAARIELRMRGVRDTVLVLELSRPPPRIVAHRFRVHAGSAAIPDGLPSGRYTVTARLASSAGRTIAASTPLSVTVGRP